MEVLTILALRHSGIGNPLHSQVIDILTEFGYGSELHDWCVEHKVGTTHDESMDNS